jgi:predicted glycoside hydrolase/deacetylase ChbG (UPF0249 family)
MPMQAGLIINADDLGLDESTTRGIVSAFQQGLVSSASLIVTMPTGGDAAKIALAAKVPVGLHVDLTQGHAITGAQFARIADESGVFKLSASELIRMSRRDIALIDQIRGEIRAQLGRAADFGLKLTHVDSHQHVHMSPTIFAVLEEEASKFDVKHIRFSRESPRNLFLGRAYAAILARNNFPKWAILRAHSVRIKPQLETPDVFFGILHSGSVVKRVLLDFLRTAPAHRSVEICIHPGLPEQSAAKINNRFSAFSSSVLRRLEYDALVDSEVIALVRKRGLVLRSFDGKAK